MDTSRVFQPSQAVFGVLIGLSLLTHALAAFGEGHPKPVFRDVAKESGLDFTHWNGMTGELYFPEMTGAGGALFDYDGDGDLDVYLLQGAVLAPGKTAKESLFPFPGKEPPRDRLFRNDLKVGKDGSPILRFIDVTEESGLRATGYGMGVAVGDVDRDGHLDLYLTNFGPDQLWRSKGVGKSGQVTFENVTATAGLGAPGWSSSAAFLDFDGDGWLDLYVVSYVRYSVEKNTVCYATSSRRDYCGPDAFTPAADHLYRNRGLGADGKVRFEDLAVPLGIAANPGPGLGLVSGDFDGNGSIDLYVSNDGKANFLWIRGPQGFADDALLTGLAVNRLGRPEAGMGVDAGDFDGDGDDDLFVAHLAGESNTLYVAEAGGIFNDRTLALGLGAPSLPFTSFGTAFLDYDNDGWLDLMVASGAVKAQEELARRGDPYPLGQPNQLFHSRPSAGGRRFHDVSPLAGTAFARLEVSRGIAVGDLDNDGDPDVLLTNNNGPARLLQNTLGQSKSWLGLRLLNTAGDEAEGARVAVERRGASTLWRRAARDGSFVSAHDSRTLFGLGENSEVTRIQVIWSDGTEERFPPQPLRKYSDLRQGQGAREEKRK
jgi:hypothetical protein